MNADDAVDVERAVEVERIAEAVAQGVGSVQKLVNDVRSESGAERMGAVAAASKLLDKRATHAVFASVGGVEVLVGLLRDGHGVEKEKAAEALAKLSENEEMHALMLAADCVPVFVAMLRDGEDKERENAADVLSKLSENDNTHSVLLAKGAVSALLTHARGLSAAQPSTPPSEPRGNPQATVFFSPTPIAPATGASAIDGSTTEGVFDEFTSMINRFLSEIMGNGEGSEVGAGESPSESLLGRLLRVGSDTEKEQALSALANIAKYRGITLPSANKFIPQLVEVVKDPGSYAQVAAATILDYIALHDKNDCRTIGEAGVIPPLVARLKYARDQHQLDVVNALWSISFCKDNVAAILEAGGMAALLDVVRESVSNIQDRAMGVISNLTDHPQGQAAFVLRGGIPLYLELIGSTNHNLRREAQTCLVALSKSPAIVEDMIKLVVALVRHLDRHHDAFDDAFRHLAELSENPALLNLIATTDVAPLLVEISRDRSFCSRKPFVKEIAANMLERLPIRSDEITPRSSKRART